MTEQFCQICVCGRSFSRISDFTKHERGCTKGKKRLSRALSKAKETYQRKKIRMGLEEPQPDQVLDDDGLLCPEPVCTMILISNLVILTEVM